MCLFEYISATQLYQTIISFEIINKQKLHHVKKIFSFLCFKRLPIKICVPLVILYSSNEGKKYGMISAEIVLIKILVKKKSCF
jgi:hypothetical protein